MFFTLSISAMIKSISFCLLSLYTLHFSRALWAASILFLLSMTWLLSSSKRIFDSYRVLYDYFRLCYVCWVWVMAKNTIDSILFCSIFIELISFWSILTFFYKSVFFLLKSCITFVALSITALLWFIVAVKVSISSFNFLKFCLFSLIASVSSNFLWVYFSSIYLQVSLIISSVSRIALFN